MPDNTGLSFTQTLQAAIWLNKLSQGDFLGGRCPAVGPQVKSNQQVVQPLNADPT